MMKAIKNFMKKPITWGDSFKWSGIALGLYAAVIGAIAAYEKWIAYKDKAERLDKYNSFRDGANPDDSQYAAGGSAVLGGGPKSL